MCIGSENAPRCADPHRTCDLDAEGVLLLCLENCHPLVQDCPDGEGCYPVGQGFACGWETGGATGAHGDTCQHLTACDPGLACIGANYVAGNCNPDGPGCCAAYCTLTGEANCPGEGEECDPWFEPADAPVPYEDVGVCIIPP